VNKKILFKNTAAYGFDLRGGFSYPVWMKKILWFFTKVFLDFLSI